VKESEFYEANPPPDPEKPSSGPVKTASTYKAGTIIVNQRQVKAI
jgi:hypothetical protein